MSKQWFYGSSGAYEALCFVSYLSSSDTALLAVWNISDVRRQNTHGAEMENIINAWQSFMGDSLLCKFEE